jgi:hypothetical protein
MKYGCELGDIGYALLCRKHAKRNVAIKKWGEQLALFKAGKTDQNPGSMGDGLHVWGILS